MPPTQGFPPVPLIRVCRALYISLSESILLLRDVFYHPRALLVSFQVQPSRWMTQLTYFLKVFKCLMSFEKWMLLNCGAGEDSWESPLDCKIKPVNPKGNQPWRFFWRTDAEAEAPIFWLPDVKSWLIRKDSDAGKDWWQKEKGATVDEMVG